MLGTDCDPTPHASRSAQGGEEVEELGRKKLKGHVDFSKISKVHFLSKRVVGNSEEVRTNLKTKIQHCTKTGGKSKFISVLLFFFTLV